MVEGVTYYYTLDGSAPTSSSTKYDGEVTLAAPNSDEKETITIKVIGIKEGAIDSEVATATVTYAAKSVTQYTITFKDWDGTELKEETVEHGGSATEPSAPEREGYTFTGWDVAFDNVTKDLTVTAQYGIKAYTVSFDVAEGSTVEPQTVNHGEEATEPSTPEREGYSFTGWYVDETLTMEFDFGTEIMADTTIYAKWKVNQYTITFDSDGGSAVDPITLDYGAVVTAPEDPEREDYTFAGWNPLVPETMPANNLEVTAQWTVNEYTVTFVDWDDQVIEVQTVEHGTSAPAPSVPVREGYTFTDWDVAFDNVTKDLTVTAQYKMKAYAVSFDVGEGSTVEPQIVNHGKEATEPSAPERKGYTFMGWYADEALEIEFAFDTEITADITIYAKWEINIYMVSFDVTPEDATVVVIDSEDIEVTAEDDGSYKLKPGDYTYIVDAEGYIAKEASLTVATTDQSITVDLEPLIVIGDETVGELYIVNRDHTDNSVINDDIGPVTINIGNQDVTQSFDFVFYDQDGGNEITNFDLSKGATTFRAFMEATSQDYNDVSTNVVFKYRSVTIGDNEKYYTIEDALAEADSGDMVYVKYNTSFADTDIAGEVYDSTGFTIKSGVTLLVPYSSDLSCEIEDTPGGTSGALSQESAYVELTIPTGVKLNVEGELIVNAMRASYSTRFTGHVTGTNYAQLHLQKGSNITVNDGGSFTSIGFIYGEGALEALSGASILEAMFVRSFRGGSASLRVFSSVFPFDQYTVNNIEVKTTINSGAEYTGKALIYASSSYNGGDVKLVGGQNDYLLELTDGKIIKTYEKGTGRVSFEVKGNASINNTGFKAGNLTANSNGRDLPFDGTWSINVTSGSNVTINSWVMLLPGASVDIEQQAEVTVSENGKITVFDPYEHLDEYNSYPTEAEKYYRSTPVFDYDSTTPARLTVDGNLTVKGGLAGRVHEGESGQVTLDEDSSTTYDVKYVMGNKDTAKAYAREVTLWWEGDTTLSIVVTPNGTEITVVATVKDGDNEPLKGVKLLFSGGNGEWVDESATTNEHGKATTIYNAGQGDGELTRLTVEIEGSDDSATGSINTSSCPFVYSYDGEEYHFEHESITFAVNKGLETTSYGTLRNLKDVNGKYYVRIAEELDEKSFVNGFKLKAVDYLEGQGIQEVFADIFGTSHTIKERIVPIAFIDSYGNSWLEEITTDGQMVAEYSGKFNQGDFLTSYTATFRKPENAGDEAKFMISIQQTDFTTDLWHGVLNKLDARNNMWWIEEVMNLPENKDMFVDFFNTVNLMVELWDGEEWIEQGQVKAGVHLLEEFLVTLDISKLDHGVEEIKVRLTSGTGLYEIDRVTIDFSPNQIANITELVPVSALFNEQYDVKDMLGDFDNNDRVKMLKGDNIDLLYDVPQLAEGHDRGFMVALKGYYHMDADSKENPIADEWVNMSTEDVIMALITMGDEDAIKVMPEFEWISNVIDSISDASYEEKMVNGIAGQVLPWLMDEQ